MNLIEQLMSERPTDWMEALRERHIHITRDGHLASLRYDQLNSPMRDPIVQQCRGMIVDVERRKVLARPYDKFWNHGEHLAARVDWSTARVLEKLDGSLMLLYWQDRETAWCVGSSGHPTAGGRGGQLREAFWRLAPQFSIQEGDREYTYMFELCEAQSRIVVHYETPRLVLHGARHTMSGRELDHDELTLHGTRLGVEVVRTFPANSMEECQRMAELLDPMRQEGFVVADKKGNRVKVKSAAYVAVHLMKGEITRRRAVELWQSGETSEVLVHFPQFAAVFTPVHDALNALSVRVSADYERIRHVEDRKAFALLAKDMPYPSLLFRLRSESPTCGEAERVTRQLLRKLTSSVLEGMLP